MFLPTRRTFLKQLGAGAGALVLGAALDQRAWAATRGLPRSTPEAEGVSSAAIEAFLDALAQSNTSSIASLSRGMGG